MRITERLLLLLVLLVCMSLVGCGKSKEPLSVSETTTLEAENWEDTEDVEDAEDPEDDAPIREDELIVKGEGETTQASTTAPVIASSTSHTTAAKTNSTQTVTTTAARSTNTADTPVSDGKVVSGIIDLSKGMYQGEGISIEGSKVVITGEGTYVLSGSMSGMVEVNTTLKVKLKLNGVNIRNASGPAILCTDAKRLTLTLIEGTYNYLEDGSNTVYDGAICTNDTLEIKGAGTLEVRANNRHGISSDDDIIINNGTITVNAEKTGLMANDDITISGGNLTINGRTNGIKSKGTLHISGGTSFIKGGAKENKSAIYSASAFILTGGNVYAIGCGASEPDSASTQNAISVKYVPSLGAGSKAVIVLNGENMSMSSADAYNTFFISTPSISSGAGFTVWGNETCYGEFAVTGQLTAVTAEPIPEETMPAEAAPTEQPVETEVLAETVAETEET